MKSRGKYLNDYRSLIKGSELVIRTLGFWPTFHDAEILKLVLNRKGPSLTIHILLAERSMPAAPLGHFRLVLSFQDLDGVEIEAFNYQNVIASLDIAMITETPFFSNTPQQRLRVEIESSFGAGCTFSCREAAVVFVGAAPKAPKIRYPVNSTR